MPNALPELVQIIRNGISQRGFFVLFDDRLTLICGGQFDGHNLVAVAAVDMFAMKNHWHASVAGNTVTFLPGELVLAPAV